VVVLVDGDGDVIGALRSVAFPRASSITRQQLGTSADGDSSEVAQVERSNSRGAQSLCDRDDDTVDQAKMQSPVLLM
jgi:hypothetical protein